MQVNLFFDWLSNGELLTLKTGPPCIWPSSGAQLISQSAGCVFKRGETVRPML